MVLENRQRVHMHRTYVHTRVRRYVRTRVSRFDQSSRYGGLWFIVYDLWFIVYGLWFMVYEVRSRQA